MWEILDSCRYSRTLQSEVQVQLRDVVAGLLGLVKLIPSEDIAVKGLEGKREDILAATGQIWQTCDRMNKIAQLGIVGMATEKVDAYHALVKDAVEELEAWDPDEEEGSLFGSSDSGESAGVANKVSGHTNGEAHEDQEELEAPALEAPALGGLQIKDMHAAKEGALKGLKLIRMLYPALRKRRVLTFGMTSANIDMMTSLGTLPPEESVKVFDQLLQHLKVFSEETDEVVGALYGGDGSEVDRRLAGMKRMAEGCVDEVKNGWDGREDEFSEWSGKWLVKLKETGSS
ncbi:MAG: hypothetical protein Q9170_007847 [Blastenia crenularia]